MNKFIFHNIGQGLFYSGHLHDDDFNFIYDCGSISKAKFINNAIDNQLPSKPIDFVIISHLHDDHINGLARLHNKYNINKIYLPYLGYDNSNLVKLLVAKAVLISDKDGFIDGAMLETYNFIINLYDTDKKADRQTDVEFIGIDGEPEHDNTHVVYSQKEFCDANGDWKFIMFNKRCSDSILTSLETNIKLELVKHGFNDVTDFIRNRGIKDIAKIYETVFGKNGIKPNLTSTILIHYPIKEMNVCYPFNYNICLINKFKYHNTKPITILTGDAEFDEEMLSKLSDELTMHLDAFVIFQVPHHGSKENWHLLTNNYKYGFNQYVIPFGLGNQYSHPNEEVINELSILKVSSVSMVTEITAFQYSIL